MVAKRPGREGRPWRELRKWVKRTQRVCHLCGEPMDLAIKWPDPRSFSVDHVVPISQAPELALSRANVRAAHLGCNSSKGSGGSKSKRITSEDW